jgi:N-acetylglucosamine malate deacetylase 2
MPPMYARSLIVVAHPGDEILSCARLLLREPGENLILHIANGAGGIQRDWTAVGARSAPDFGRIRTKEARKALEVLGVARDRVSSMGLPERGILHEFEAVLATILRLVREERPIDLYTHPFEGGHPDADATCYAVHTAMDQLREEGEVVPVLHEFTSFHARDGLFHASDFLNPYPAAQVSMLSEKECKTKQEALRLLRCQHNLIARFALCEEKWRRAERYDFGCKPHKGKLYYELTSTGYTWQDFQRFVQSRMQAAENEARPDTKG